MIETTLRKDGKKHYRFTLISGGGWGNDIEYIIEHFIKPDQIVREDISYGWHHAIFKIHFNKDGQAVVVDFDDVEMITLYAADSFSDETILDACARVIAEKTELILRDKWKPDEDPIG